VRHLMLLSTLTLPLASCGEPASCWNEHRARFTSCADMRADETEKLLSRREERMGKLE